MKEKKTIERKISIVMRIGVSIAALFMIIGFLLLLIEDINSINTYNSIDFIELIKNLTNFNPYSFMMLGIFLLILTPVLRVLLSIILFIKEKDKLYTLITFFVLIILIISFIVGFIIH